MGILIIHYHHYHGVSRVSFNSASTRNLKIRSWPDLSLILCFPYKESEVNF